MNRPILIVICDFLLLSLLTFSTDINHIASERTQQPTRLVPAMNIAATSGKDLANVMKQALVDEQKNRKELERQLALAREDSSARTDEKAQLQQQYAAQTNIQQLDHQLQNNFEQTQQQLATATSAMQRQSLAYQSLQQELKSIAESNQFAWTQNQKLTNQLMIAEAERRAADEKAALMQQEADATRAEYAHINEGLKTLATNSSELAEEIRDNRAMAPNNIFSDFVSNRVEAGISAWRSGLFLMDTHSVKKTDTVLVTDGTNIFALYHVRDTPLALWDPGTDWDKLDGTMKWNQAQVPVHSILFNATDPRVVMLPISQAEADKLGCKIYSLSSDPYKFQDAVLVGANGEYYGQCNFQIEPHTPQYVRLDRNLLKGLFGKFNPSRGDLVFSRRGKLLGIMVNNTYCLLIRSLAATATLPFGQDLHNDHTGELLSRLYDYIFQLPLQLQ